MNRKITKKIKYQEINPEDIFLDSANLPGFDEFALEGRIERPMSARTFLYLKIFLVLIIAALTAKLWILGAVNGKANALISDRNRLSETFIFANRGIITDRTGRILASNDIKTEGQDFSHRIYAPYAGLAHVVGYVKYPKRDSSGNYYDREYQPRDGAERTFNGILRGKNGTKLVEEDVTGGITSESVVEKPVDGKTLVLSLDAKVNEAMHKAIANLAATSGFQGGAGVIIDVDTGEILALTSYPEYDQNALTKGVDQKTFSALLNDQGKPFLNRAIGGLYTPGSIVKPILALAALNEKIISPEKEIFSSGSITVPNPYDPKKPSVFDDWKAHGYTAMREALAVSSDTYFYSIGGGFGGQKGLGIGLIDKYFKMFALEEPTGIELFGELEGLIPTPEWKAKKFNGDIWRLGDTFITAIGQYGTQITPLNAARFTAAIASKGRILKPQLLASSTPVVQKTLEFRDEDWKVVHQGMREGVTYGTSVGLNVLYVEAAGKTGTAEVGSAKKYVHSWSIGFFPYKNPKYAWAVIMEKGPSTNTIGATSVMRHVLDWMNIYAPEYLK